VKKAYEFVGFTLEYTLFLMKERHTTHKTHYSEREVRETGFTFDSSKLLQGTTD
jgi:hypothetical protein